MGALIYKTHSMGGAYSEGGAYWKEGANSNHYGTYAAYTAVEITSIDDSVFSLNSKGPN